LGFLGSIYGSIVFQRWNRFKNIMRDVALARINYEGYPTKPETLEMSLNKTNEFWRLINIKFLELTADGHFEAGKEVGTLQSFTYRTAAHIENMLNLKNEQQVGIYLQAFQIEYKRIYDEEFIQFENKLKPNIKALLIPKPHPITAIKSVTVLVDYFDKLFTR